MKKNVTISFEQRYIQLTQMRTRVPKETQRSERYKGRDMGMKRKIFAVLLMLVLSVICVACDMGEAVENGSSNAVVNMEGEAKEKAEATSTPTPTVAPTSTPTPTVVPTSTPTPTPTVAPTSTPMPTHTIAPTPTEQSIVDVMVWLPATGEKYHNKNNCGRMNPSKARQVTKSEAERRGYEPCSKCY